MSVSAQTRDDDRQAWLKWRRQGLGGSDAAVVAGLDPYRTLIELYLNKVGLLETEASEAMLWGTLLEDPIRGEFMNRSGLFVGAAQTLAVHPDHPWMRATLDGLVYESGSDIADSWLGIYEGKTTAAIRFGMDWGDEPPMWVHCQVQHNMAVTGAQRAWVTCLVGGQRLETYEVGRDQETIDYLVDSEKWFWENHVLAENPPPAVGTDSELDAIKEAYRNARPDLPGVDLDDQRELVLELIGKHQKAKAMESAAAKLVREAQADLCLLIGEAQAARLNGLDVITWRAHERSSVDLQRLRIDYHGLVDKYTKKQMVRTFRVAQDWQEVLKAHE